jgi:hypothetical protein
LLTASLVTLFLVPLGDVYWLFFSAIGVSLVAVSIKRLRHAGLGWGWVFVGLIPVLGWATLAILLNLGPRDSAPPDTLPRRIAVTTASFLTLVLLSTSFSLAATDSELGQQASGEWQSQQESSDLPNAPEQKEASEIEANRPPDATNDENADEEPAEATEEDVARQGDVGSQADQNTLDASFDQLVASLRVEPEFVSEYSRDLFRHWIDASGNGCNARQEVLIAESLTPVTLGARCSISGGTWYSQFDGLTFVDSSQLDVDHFVPLAEARRSGAHTWDSGTRERFANDLQYSMSLIAVSASSNRSKGDRDVAGWMPPNSAFTCEYLYSWAQVKVRWSLSVDESEKAALQRNWAGCSEGNLIQRSSAGQAPVGVVTPGTSPSDQPNLPSSPPTSANDAVDECVNINSASTSDLQRIVHIGPARAVSVEQLRPFSDVDHMIRVFAVCGALAPRWHQGRRTGMR